MPPIELQNSSRLSSLIRAGNLYLSARDVVALSIENNIDVEIQRYGPLLAQQVLKRAQAGGALRSVGLGVASRTPKRQPAGRQRQRFRRRRHQRRQRRRLRWRHCHPVGPPDPIARSDHLRPRQFRTRTFPQSNLVLTNTAVLVDTTRTYEAQYVQNFEFGLTAQLTYLSTRSEPEQRVL